MGRTILSLVLALGVCGSSAWAAPSPAGVARAKARTLAKEGRNLEAASELRAAAELVGAEGPSLRFEAALLLQKSGELKDARALHMEVSTDSEADFQLRGQARYAAETLFWVLQLTALTSPSRDRLDKLRETIVSTARRVAEAQSDGKELAPRLSVTAEQLTSTRKSLLPLVGPSDPMVLELDTLLKDLATGKKSMSAMKKDVGAAKKGLAKARKVLGKLDKGIDKLAAYAAKQTTRARKGEGKLAALKKHHDELLSGGAKAARFAVGNIRGAESSLRRVESALSAATQAANTIEDAIGAAENVLQGAP